MPMTCNYKNPNPCPVLTTLYMRKRNPRLNNPKNNTLAKFKSDKGKNTA